MTIRRIKFLAMIERPGPKATPSLIARLLCVFTLAVTASCSGHQDVHGFAGTYVIPKSLDDIGVTAHLSLPERSTNHSWYTTWVMLLSYGDLRTAPFVQCGLIRWSGSEYQTVPFLAYQEPSGKFIFKEFPNVVAPDGANASVSMSRQRLDLVVAGSSVLSTAAKRFFKSGQRLHFEVGDEVSAYGDELSGIISGIRAIDGLKTSNVYPRCGFANTGLRLESGPNSTLIGIGKLVDDAGRFFDIASAATVNTCLG